MASAPAIDVAALLAQMAALTEQVAKLSAAAAPPVSKKVRKSAASAAAPAPAPASAEKPKRQLNAKIAGEGGWNAFVAAILERASAEGWPVFTEADGTEWPASVSAADGLPAFPDGKKMSRAHGGLIYASWLKAQSDPEAAARALATKQRRAAQKAAKGAAASEGESAAAAAKPASKRSEAAKARYADPAAREALRARLAAGKAAKKATGAAAEAPSAAPAADLNFESWEFEGASYAKNARGDVITEEGDWVGRFDGTQIDRSVPKPADIDAYIGLE
jgi:hypothetical protein